MSDFATGDLFAGFRIEAVLGSGGMGTVYRVLDLNLDRERALKVLTPDLTRDEDFRQRFQRESRLAAQLEEEGVVPIYGAGEADGHLYIVMRLVRGPDLHTLVAETGPLGLARTVDVTAAVAGALDAAHARGIVHRDVKPANILVEPSDPGERVFLTDFGVSRPDTGTTSITSAGQLLGTPDYISPEQIDGARAEARSDIYALGCVVCFLLTGEPPFHRESAVATLYAHAHADRPRPSLLEPELPPAVDEVLARATALDPADRHASAGELAADLARAVDPSAAPTVRAPITPRTRVLDQPPGRRRWVAAALGVLVAAAAIAAIAVLLWPDEADNPPVAPPDAPSDLVSSIRLGHPTDSVVVGELNVLAGSGRDSTVSAIDPATEKVGEEPREVADPTSVAVGFGSVWVTSRSDDRLLRYGPTARQRARPIEVGSEPADVAVGRRWVWVANRGDDTVTQIDPLHDNRTVATIPVAPGPERIATEDEITWVASPSARALTRLVSTGEETTADVVRLGGRPVDLVIDGGSLWELDEARGSLVKLSLEDGGQIGEPIAIGGKLAAAAVGPNAIWVADKGGDQAIRVDPQQPDVQERYDVGQRPVALAVGSGSVWVANAGDPNISRIDR